MWTINTYDHGGWNNANCIWNQGDVQPPSEFDDRKGSSKLEDMLAKWIQSTEIQCQNFHGIFQDQDHKDSKLQDMFTKFIINVKSRSHH